MSDRHDPLKEYEEAQIAKKQDEQTLVCVIPPSAHIEKNTLVLTKQEACSFIASLAIQLASL